VRLQPDTQNLIVAMPEIPERKKPDFFQKKFRHKEICRNFSRQEDMKNQPENFVHKKSGKNFSGFSPMSGSGTAWGFLYKQGSPSIVLVP
jgi:hypothetical protein